MFKEGTCATELSRAVAEPMTALPGATMRTTVPPHLSFSIKMVLASTSLASPSQLTPGLSIYLPSECFLNFYLFFFFGVLFEMVACVWFVLNEVGALVADHPPVRISGGWGRKSERERERERVRERVSVCV